MSNTLKKLIEQITSDVFEETKESDKLPSIVDFKGEWVSPDEKHIEDQLRLASCLFDIEYEQLLAILARAKPSVLSNEIWSELENTLSWHVTNADEAKSIANEYGYHYNGPLFSLKNSRKVTLPVIILKPGERPYAVSGEPELLFASAFKIKPHVLFVKLG